MKISLEWLGDFLSGPLEAKQAADALTNAGLPVESIETYGGDTVLDVEVTSNRGDCLSHIGVARELAALLDRPVREVSAEAAESDPAAGEVVGVRADAPQLCPHYTARIIRGVKIGPSPEWLARRLTAVGVRPINNVVDVTNYVMFEMGQPLHAFDFAKIGGGKIVVRTATRGEMITSIDGRQRQLSGEMLVIADAQKPVALAGVMGGAESEVSAGTTDILLESARFDPLSVRRTARALAMKSDSSYRFERGIDPALPVRAGLRAAQLILQTAGGRLLKGVVAAGSGETERKNLSLRLSRLKQILGVELPGDEVVAAFARLGLSPKLHGDRIDVTVPSYRLDISAEIDLVEEAARVLGYDRIPTRKEISIQLAPPDPKSITVETICQTLVAGGSARKADAFLLPSLLPGLLEAVRLNEANGTPGARLFEIGATFVFDGAKVDERRRIACVGGDELREMRGVVEAVLRKLDAERAVRVAADHSPGFARHGGGRIYWGDEAIGFLGKIDAGVAGKLSLRHTPMAAEMELGALLAGHRHVPQLKELPKFPPVRRDISLIVRAGLAFEKIESLIRGLKLPDLESLEFVTAYRGKPLDAGQKSVTITLVFRSSTTTLTSEHVESSVRLAVEAAQKELGATLRT